MNIKKVTAICFSPTGTSYRNMMAVAKGLNAPEVNVRDYTLVHNDETKYDEPLTNDDIAIFSVPVYGGHVPPIALNRMAAVEGNRTPAILLVTYGNRDFENALSELENFVIGHGFMPIAAGAMIGEHSYSNDAYPIAAGRPDAEDLTSAECFGRKVADKLREKPQNEWNINVTADMPKVDTPKASHQAFVQFIQTYSQQQQLNPTKAYPTVDTNLCHHCGKCAENCPTQAIPVGNEEETITSQCIRCCACVKGCPVGARTLLSPFAKPLSENFQMRREALYLC